LNDTKSLLIYHDYAEQIEALSGDECKILMIALINYSKFGQIDELHGAAKMAFIFIKQQIDRDAEKWEKTRNNRSNAGKRSAEMRANIQQTATDNNKGEQATTDNQQNQLNSKSNSNSNKEKNNIKKESESKPRFTKPTPQDVDEYCNTRSNGISGQHFCDYYEARGWILSNGRKMKDWKAAVRTWEQNNKANAPPNKPQGYTYGGEHGGDKDGDSS